MQLWMLAPLCLESAGSQVASGKPGVSRACCPGRLMAGQASSASHDFHGGPMIFGLARAFALLRRAVRRYRVQANRLRQRNWDRREREPGHLRSRGRNISHCRQRAQVNRRAKARSQAAATNCSAALQEISPRA